MAGADHRQKVIAALQSNATHAKPRVTCGDKLAMRRAMALLLTTTATTTTRTTIRGRRVAR
ncbi:MAG: hypothetical protein C0471_00840 [Erythrobacter sp.]|nr:hypothetical protein [Erythrobacter sp.]